jgi:membrane protein
MAQLDHPDTQAGRGAPDRPPPAGPSDLGAGGWWAVTRRAVKEFRRRQMTDAAAALTYYAVLSIFPMLLALVALVGVLGRYPSTVNSIMEIVGQVAPRSTVTTLNGTLTSVVQDKGGAGALLGVGVLGALWSASGYIGAFIRASNRIYAIEEGRPAWKLAPLQLAITIALVVVIAVLAIGYIFTGKLAHAAGSTLGLPSGAIAAWQIAKWPVMALIASLLLSTLYYLAPNVRQPRFRWITPGGVAGLLVVILASAGFAFYVANFGSYNKTYGSLGGVIVFLVWLWIANVSLLFGAQVNAELERERRARAGEEVEREPFAEPRDTRKLQRPAQVAR